jgi:hypothetical protein
MALVNKPITVTTVPSSVRDYRVSYSASSLYAKTPIVGRFLDFWVSISIPPDITDKIFVVKRQDWVHRPDIIALEYYGDEMLFWVFGVRNGLDDLVFDIKYGTVLFFPSQARLSALGIGGPGLI